MKGYGNGRMTMTLFSSVECPNATTTCPARIRRDALFLCLVGEHRTKRNVTNALDVRYTRVELSSITMRPRESTSTPTFSR
jgi:hypothetical protein